MNYKVIGYGSLISHESLKKTISDKCFTPVIIKGYKRIFNLAVKSDQGPNVLNLAKSKDHEFNGVLFELDDSELNALKRREYHYNLEETKAYDFTTKKLLGMSLVVIDYYVCIDHLHRCPNKPYFILCREAAYEISEKFGKFWDETTYTSGNEKISDWIKKNPNYDTIKKEKKN